MDLICGVDGPTSDVPQLAFDVTFLVRRAFARPTGIDRVQLEIAAELALRQDPGVEFFWFDERAGIFEHVDSARVLELANAMRGAASTEPATNATAHDRSNIADGRLKRIVKRSLADWPEVSRHAVMAGGHSRRATKEVRETVRALGHVVADRRRPPSDRCCSNGWTHSTTVFSLGMDFARYKSYIEARKADRQYKVALIVYDLIPIVKPQYATIEFVSFILSILDLADVVLVISETTEADLRAFALARGRALPMIAKVPLGSALRDLEPTCPPLFASQPETSGSGFVLFVSTLTLRKNHHLLFDVWEMLLAELDPVNVPNLVIAGQRGPVSTETQSRLDRTPEFAGVVHHLESATDAEIAWLYANCTFTVYPSLYEGWGLPVSESHDFTKLCLASNRASLPEASDGLAELLDPFDRDAWKERIMKFWSDTAGRTTRQDEIGRRHRRVTAADTAHAVLDIAGVSRPSLMDLTDPDRV